MPQNACSPRAYARFMAPILQRVLANRLHLAGMVLLLLALVAAAMMIMSPAH